MSQWAMATTACGGEGNVTQRSKGQTHCRWPDGTLFQKLRQFSGRLRLMLLRFLLLLGLFSRGAEAADWKRHIQTVTGSWADFPPARSLSYFQVDPCARSDPKDRFLQCGYEKPAAASQKNPTRLIEVGRIGGHTVFDLTYEPFRDERGKVWPIQLRSVLVKVGPDLFREVRVEEVNGEVLPTRIITVGHEKLLMIKYEDGGMYHYVYEDYLFVTPDGLERLDFEPVETAATKALPPGQFNWQPTTVYGLDKLIYRIDSGKQRRRMACCDGRVEVPYKIENGKVIPGKAVYKPLP